MNPAASIQDATLAAKSTIGQSIQHPVAPSTSIVHHRRIHKFLGSDNHDRVEFEVYYFLFGS